jgi:outer membrane immunogenic protein
MRLTTLLGSAIIGLGMATAASAADLPRKAPAYVAPIGYNWTGLYVGLNAGYGFSREGDANGFVGGGQIGYNWQASGSPFVFGLEADFQGNDQDTSVTVGAATATARIRSFGTVRGRIGYAWDRVMVYGTGGFAYQNSNVDLTVAGVTASSSGYDSGYAIGGGIEWAVWDRMSLAAEYLYVGVEDRSVTVGGLTATGNLDNNIVRAKLNYRF